MSELKTPKLFISYSWTTPEHEAWVLNLATELRESGIDVILDKWDLKEGQDAHAFMERMVADESVEKVIIVCDKAYAEKADAREGGVGTETQIISPEVYNSVTQTKFVAVISQKDVNGKPYLPTYYKSRIYIDLSDVDLYAKNFEQLLRWVFDKPPYLKPDLGQPPAFLDEAPSISLETSALFRRVLDAVRNSKSYASGAVTGYLDTYAANLGRFRLEASKGDTTFDEKIIENIERFTSFRNEAVEVFTAISQYDQPPGSAKHLHRFFEAVIPYLFEPGHNQSWHKWDFDNFKFIINELFLYCIAVLLKYERFVSVSILTLQRYHFVLASDSSIGPMNHFSVFSNSLYSLEHRKERLKMRRLSVHADLLKERCKGIGISFDHLMQADYFLFLADCIEALKIRGGPSWWPVTLVYKVRSDKSFELFARCESQNYFDRFKITLGITDKNELDQVVEAFKIRQWRVPTWGFDSISPTHLMGYEALCTRK